MANGDLINFWALAGRALPGSTAGDSIYAPTRMSRRGELYEQSLLGSKQHALADEGTYYVATNATLGTAITGTAAPTSFSATVALMTLFNNNAASATGKRIYLDWISLEPKAAGTNGTNFLVAMNVDTGNRFSSGGTTVTPVNPNMDDSSTSNGVLNVGALTSTAATGSVRRVWHGQVRSVIKVIGDRYLFTFGSSAPVSTGMPTEGTLQAIIPIQCPPVVIGPQQSFLLHEIAASQSVAATWEFSMGYWER